MVKLHRCQLNPYFMLAQRNVIEKTWKQHRFNERVPSGQGVTSQNKTSHYYLHHYHHHHHPSWKEISLVPDMFVLLPTQNVVFQANCFA